jgi:hypothetical protein
MTISLRSFASAAGIAVLALTFAACGDNSTDPIAGPMPGVASRSTGNTGNTGNYAKNGSIVARVLVDKSGNALLEVRTGMFVDETNIGIADGWFQTLQYKISNASGKEVFVKNVNFKKSGATKFVTWIDLCSRGSDDDEAGNQQSSSCSTHFGPGWTASVQAELKGVGGDDKKTDVVRQEARLGNLPDVDLTSQSLYVVSNGAQLPAGTVAPATPTTFSVTFPNNKAINGVPNAIGVTTACVVTVDGRIQAPVLPAQYNALLNPLAFGYVGSATANIAAGASAPCQFTLTLPAGPHKIAVTAAVTYPGDYDISNNTTATFTVNAAAQNIPVDLVANAIQRVGNGVNASTIVAIDTARVGGTVVVRTTVQNPTAAYTAINCSITADPALGATAVGSTSNVTVPANGSATCQYTLNANALGTYPISITVTPTTGSPVDPNSTNNTASATLKVVAAGKFTSVNLSSMDLQQQWFNLVGANATPIDSLTLQNVRAGGLSLVVVPTQNVLGTFTLKGTVISGGTTFPSGTVSGTLMKSVSGLSCGITAGPNAPFSGVPAGFPTQIGYFAEVCAEPATVNGLAGFQQITVSYVQSLSGSVMNPGQYALSGAVQIKLELSFTLTGAATADKATATVTIPVPTPQLRSLTNLDGTRVLWTEQNPAPPVVTTP